MSVKTAFVAIENIPYSADILYEYLIPESLDALVYEGTVVVCPFGFGNHKVRGIVMKFGKCSDSFTSLKYISDIYDVRRYIDNDGLRLAEYMKNRTFCTYFDAVKSIMPSGIMSGFDIVFVFKNNTGIKNIDDYFKANKNVVKKKKLMHDLDKADYHKVLDFVKQGIIEEIMKASNSVGDKTYNSVCLFKDNANAFELEIRDKSGVNSEKYKKVINYLKKEGTTSVKNLMYMTGVSSSVVKTLSKKQILNLTRTDLYRNPLKNKIQTKDNSPIILNEEQQNAYEQIILNLYTGKAHLLYGVTGSGKTLVYMKIIDKVISDGRTALLLVPEISLTLQTVDIFCRRYGDSIAVLHSGMSIGERYDEWKRISEGKCNVVVGTRSAVFAPLKKIGLVIIDEEQEHTYKSEMTPKYGAAEIASFIVHANKALLLLTSATPSFEAYYKAENGVIGFSEIRTRYNGKPLPKVIVADMSEELLSLNRTAIGKKLSEEIYKNLKNSEQTVLFMNRRGYNSFVSCPKCKYVYRCPSCGIPLTYHKSNNMLVCHYCGYSIQPPQKCSQCGFEMMKYSGSGTQKVEEELNKLFNGCRVLRMDADTVCGKDSRDKMLSDFREHKYDILLGTQMITKGLDFPEVTLVGVLSADSLLYSSDFRAYENTFSLLTQVVGRAGRAVKDGRAVIQTFSPDHPVLQLAFEQDYKNFYKQEVALRESLIYPPYCDVCQVIFLATELSQSFDAARQFINDIKDVLQTDRYSGLPISIIQPRETAVPMVNGNHRVRVLIKCRDTSRTREMLSALYINFIKNKQNKNILVNIDMNPSVIV